MLGQPATVPDGVRFVEGIGLGGGIRIDHTEGNWTSLYPVIPKTCNERMLSEALRLKEAEVQDLKAKNTTAYEKTAEAEEKIAEAEAKAVVVKEKLEAENALLKEKLAHVNRQLFGTSSEKSTEQQPEPEQTLDEPGTTQQQVDAEAEEPAKKPRASKGGRKPLPEHLPRERIEHDLEPHDRFCPCCSKPFERIGEEVTSQFVIIPVQYKVVQHARAKYICRSCNKFVTAPGFKPMIEKSSYSSPEFLAHVACSKFQYGLPFYRQEDICKSNGIPVNRTTLSNLMIGCVDKLEALGEHLRHALLGQGFMHADETFVQVLKEPGRSPQTNSFLWLYRSIQDEARQVVFFDYQMTRSGEHPRRFLNIGTSNAYSGYLHVDGYAGYNQLTGITRVGCMAHARRKFIAARDALPKGTTGSPAHIAIQIIGKLYRIERKIKQLEHHERHKIRLEKSAPILRQFKDWLDTTYPTVVPQTPLGTAINYARGQWYALERYIENGRLAIDNNLAEREIRPVAIGRKNWLFADTMDGMRANALMYSLVQTAKANGLNPYEYLRHVFATLPYLKTAAEVESLLPWNLPHLRRTH